MESQSRYVKAATTLTKGGTNMWNIKQTQLCRECRPVADYDYSDTVALCPLHAVAPELAKSLHDVLEAIRWHFLPLVENYAKAPEAAHGKDELIAQACALLAQLESNNHQPLAGRNRRP
jgi:hypothetical protein